MPATRSQYWLTGILGILSLGSIIYTVRGNDDTNLYVQERAVESQKSIDSLTTDMNRLMKSISNWQSFCENPYAYIQSASVHGNFEIALKDHIDRDEMSALSQIERDAIARCSYTKDHPQNAQFRLCLSVKEANADAKHAQWFDHNHLFELNIQFREAGMKLLSSCSGLANQHIEVHSYFSAYTQGSETLGIKRISGGLRLPLENGSHSRF